MGEYPNPQSVYRNGEPQPFSRTPFHIRLTNIWENTILCKLRTLKDRSNFWEVSKWRAYFPGRANGEMLFIDQK